MRRIGRFFSRWSRNNISALTPDVEQRCRSAVTHIADNIDLRQVHTAQDLCAAYAQLRGQPVEFNCIDLPERFFGLCFKEADMTWICVASGLLVPHQEHIVCHEILHVELGHSLLEVESALAVLFPHIDTEFARAALRRSCAESLQERETELGGSLLKHYWYAARAPDAVQMTPADPSLQRTQFDLQQFLSRLGVDHEQEHD